MENNVSIGKKYSFSTLVKVPGMKSTYVNVLPVCNKFNYSISCCNNWKYYNSKNKKINESYTLRGGIMADEMGLGKTISMIALILENQRKIIKKPKKSDENHDKSDADDQNDENDKKNVKKRKKTKKEIKKQEENENIDEIYYEKFHNGNDKNILFETKATLIVCAPHLVAQWEKEFKTKTKLIVKKISTLTNIKGAKYIDILQSDIVIVPYSLITKCKQYIYNYDSKLPCKSSLSKASKYPMLHYFGWHRIIADEAHELSWNDLYYWKYFHANFKWYVTGTPFPQLNDSFLRALFFIGLEFSSSLSSSNYFYNFMSKLQSTSSNHHTILHDNGENDQLFDPTCYLSCNFQESSLKDTFYFNYLLWKSFKSIGFWRNTKFDVEVQTDIPPLTENVNYIELSNVEKALYDVAEFEFNLNPKNLQREICSNPCGSSLIPNYLQVKKLYQLPVPLIIHHTRELTSSLHEFTYAERSCKEISSCLSREKKRKHKDKDVIQHYEKQLRQITKNRKNAKQSLLKQANSLIVYSKLLPSSFKGELCEICNQTIVSSCSTSCSHIFCCYCIVHYINEFKKCPICHEELNFFNLENIDYRQLSNYYNGYRYNFFNVGKRDIDNLHNLLDFSDSDSDSSNSSDDIDLTRFLALRNPQSIQIDSPPSPLDDDFIALPLNNPLLKTMNKNDVITTTPMDNYDNYDINDDDFVALPLNNPLLKTTNTNKVISTTPIDDTPNNNNNNTNDVITTPIDNDDDGLRLYNPLLKTKNNKNNNNTNTNDVITTPVNDDDDVVMTTNDNNDDNTTKNKSKDNNTESDDGYKRHDPNSLPDELKDATPIEILAASYGSKMAAVADYLLWVVKDSSTVRKVIVFSQYENILTSLYDSLLLIDQTAFTNQIISCKGNIHVRTRKLANFNSMKPNAPRILMLSLLNAASGTQLEVASHVILLDPVVGTSEEARAIDAQAIARSHRLGQKSTVEAVRFIAMNTIEQIDYESAYGRPSRQKSARK